LAQETQETLVQGEKKGDFFPFAFSKDSQPVGVRSGGQVRAKKIDTDHLTGQKEAAFFPQKETAPRVGPLIRQFYAEKEVDEQKDIGVVPFQSGAATGNPLLSALSANLDHPRFGHGLPTVPDGVLKPLSHLNQGILRSDEAPVGLPPFTGPGDLIRNQGIRRQSLKLHGLIRFVPHLKKKAVKRPVGFSARRRPGK
jgi:hypothetical protein